MQRQKKTGSSKLRSKFETLRREIKADVRKQHDLYVNNLVGAVKANPRDFYRCTNSQKKDTKGIPPLKRKNGKGVAHSDLEKAEEFNGQFTDVFNKNEHTQIPLLDRSAPFMNDIAVSKDGLIKLLKGLNPSKALGSDELSSLPISVLRILDTEANKFYDRNLQLYDAALLTRYYTQYALRPFIDSEINHKRHFIKILFINKGIKFIDLPSIFKDRSVTSSIPAYFQNSEPPIICYKYNKPIRNTVFNFNKLVSDLDIHANTPES